MLLDGLVDGGMLVVAIAARCERGRDAGRWESVSIGLGSEVVELPFADFAAFEGAHDGDGGAVFVVFTVLLDAEVVDAGEAFHEAGDIVGGSVAGLDHALKDGCCGTVSARACKVWTGRTQVVERRRVVGLEMTPIETVEQILSSDLFLDHVVLEASCARVSALKLQRGARNERTRQSQLHAELSYLIVLAEVGREQARRIDDVNGRRVAHSNGLYASRRSRFRTDRRRLVCAIFALVPAQSRPQDAPSCTKAERNLLMSEDLPTLGMPTSMKRSARSRRSCRCSEGLTR